MSATSLLFIGFALLVAAFHAAVPRPGWRGALMLVANVAFVFSFTTAPLALAPYAAFLALAYGAVRAAQVARGRPSMVAFVAGTTLLFVWLKRYWFVSALGFLPFAYLTVGLSYVFFRVMGLIVDARSDPRLARIGPVAFFNFAMNFPTLIAGPIDRYQDFAQPPRTVALADVGVAATRIAAGFFKVIVVSYLFGRVQEIGAGDLFGAGRLGPVAAGVAAIGAYPLQLYFNSSGYADIVIAIGLLFGKTYPENFNRPFLAFSFIEFWSRYHMSLSNWLKDYIYTPLVTGMMRRVTQPALDPLVGAVSYFVTFFIIGVWHGSTVAFAVYGLLLAVGVSGNKLYQIYLAKRLGRKRLRALNARFAYRTVMRGLTYAYYAFCMIFFWADMGTAQRVLAALGPVGLPACLAAITAAAAVGATLVEAVLVQADRGAAAASPYARALLVSLLVFACIATEVVSAQVDAKIIYQAF